MRFGIINITLSGDLSGSFVLEDAFFDIHNYQDFGMLFNLTGADLADDTDISIIIDFYKAGGMVSATNYTDMEWNGDIYDLDSSLMGIRIIVNNTETDGFSYLGNSKSGSVNFTTAHEDWVEGSFNVQTEGYIYFSDGFEWHSVRIQGTFVAPKLW